MKKWIALALAVALMAGGGYLAYKKYFVKPGIKILETAQAKKGDVRAVLVETGIIKSQVGAVVKVGARATGTITKMGVRIGDRVKKGQTIALIDDREIRETIEQQEAAIETAKETRRQAELTYPKRVEEAKANYEYARLNHERQAELFKKGFTTAEGLDAAKRELDSTEAVYKRLIDEADTQLGITASGVKDREASLKQQRTRLSYTRIYAPMDGVVSDVTARDGETIVAGLQVANLITIMDPRMLEMWIYIDETDIGRVKTGQPVEYYVDTFPDKTFEGTIEKLYPQPVVKDSIVYYLATLIVPLEDAGFLKPEMTTHVKIISEEKKDVLTVPNAAVKYESGRQVVYKVTMKDKAERAEVKTGIVGEDSTEILSGLAESEVVATKIILPPGQNRGQNSGQSGGQNSGIGNRPQAR